MPADYAETVRRLSILSTTNNLGEKKAGLRRLFPEILLILRLDL